MNRWEEFSERGGNGFEEEMGRSFGKGRENFMEGKGSVFRKGKEQF